MTACEQITVCAVSDPGLLVSVFRDCTFTLGYNARKPYAIPRNTASLRRLTLGQVVTAVFGNIHDVRSCYCHDTNRSVS